MASPNSNKPLSTSDATKEVAIRLGDGKWESLAPKTVLQTFDDVVKKHGNKPALHQKVQTKGTPLDKTPYSTWTWKEYRTQVDLFAKSLISLDFGKGDIINILGFNSREWFVANFGAIAAGGIGAGIYATNLPEACQYITSHSKAKVIVVEGIKQLEKYQTEGLDLPFLKAIVMYGPDDLPAETKIGNATVYKFDDFMKLGADTVNDATLKQRAAAQKPGHTCTLIYTSGTTGNPKAVMITNDNITWTVGAMLTATPRGTLGPADRMISYLPLSHIAAQMLDMHLEMSTGLQIYFAQPDALKGSLGATLKQVQPTVFFGVPRVWEKIYAKLQEVAASSKGIKKTLSTWAKKQALANWESKAFASKTSSPAMYFLAKKLLHKAHVALGFDKCTAFYVSAAPIEKKILNYFSSIDIPIMELFGQSECTGPHSSNKLSAFKLGTVGRPLPGTETKIDAETGELCYRGRHIFAGYMGMEDKTKETIDEEGWLHSGDIAKLDEDNDPAILIGPSGFVSITGRIKELIITAGGENVPPVLIEDQFKLALPALSNCMVIGDKRKFLSILLCLEVEIDDESGAATNRLTSKSLKIGEKLGSTAKTTLEAGKDAKWTAYLDEGMKVANDAATSRAQRVAKWALLETDFTEKGKELTPTLKLKRSVAQAKYIDTIEELYGNKVPSYDI